MPDLSLVPPRGSGIARSNWLDLPPCSMLSTTGRSIGYPQPSVAARSRPSKISKKTSARSGASIVPCRSMTADFDPERPRAGGVAVLSSCQFIGFAVSPQRASRAVGGTSPAMRKRARRDHPEHDAPPTHHFHLSHVQETPLPHENSIGRTIHCLQMGQPCPSLALSAGGLRGLRRRLRVKRPTRLASPTPTATVSP